MLNLAQLLQREIPPLPQGTPRPPHILNDEDDTETGLRTCSVCGEDKGASEYATPGSRRCIVCRTAIETAAAEKAEKRRLRKQKEEAARAKSSKGESRTGLETILKFHETLGDSTMTPAEIGLAMQITTMLADYHCRRMAADGVIELKMVRREVRGRSRMVKGYKRKDSTV